MSKLDKHACPPSSPQHIDGSHDARSLSSGSFNRWCSAVLPLLSGTILLFSPLRGEQVRLRLQYSPRHQSPRGMTA
ncbi:hypothetical protein BC835DRAFT_781535 [Cytidiella melzeri]|nr:hypothetical protein BC835DRAFT_781535 [Cytidiella melzeri]